MLLSPAVRRAFDLAEEPDRVRERYGRTKIGPRCLLARRLVEAGARFVHGRLRLRPGVRQPVGQPQRPGQNFPHICEMAKRPYHLAGMDRAFAGAARRPARPAGCWTRRWSSS